MIKSFLYITACAIVFLLLMTFYSGQFSSKSATVFEWQKSVKVYFVDIKKAESTSCEADFVVTRSVPNAETLGPGAISVLLEGPSESEKQTAFSAINPGSLLQKFEVKNGVAYADFNSSLNQNIAGSCTVTAIRSQIEKTLLTLPDIDSVVISINGETEGILEP